MDIFNTVVVTTTYPAATRTKKASFKTTVISIIMFGYDTNETLLMSILYFIFKLRYAAVVNIIRDNVSMLYFLHKSTVSSEYCRFSEI